MKASFPVLALVFPLLWGACDNKKIEAPTAEFQLDNSFELALGQKGTCECGGLSITFDQVLEDSRCPIGLDCVWIGQVKARLTIRTATEEKVFEPSYSAIQSSFPSECIGEYAVMFFGLSPYPEGESPIKAEDYRVSLIVTKL